jgi:TonB family protein
MRIWPAVLVLVVVAGGMGLAARQSTTGGPSTIYKLGDAGLTAPVAIKQVRPRFPPAAVKDKSYFAVLVDAVVLADGTVGEVTVTKSVGEPALDDAAVKAAKQWTFKPGKRDGRAVAVRVPLEMTYTKK